MAIMSMVSMVWIGVAEWPSYDNPVSRVVMPVWVVVFRSRDNKWFGPMFAWMTVRVMT